jgi:hypothetical protein
MLDDKSYVVKRFFNIGNGKDNVAIRENGDNLVQDLIRIKQGTYFLEKFYERADETETEVERSKSHNIHGTALVLSGSTGFEFTDVFLMREVVGDSGPSPASGVTAEKYTLELTSHELCLDSPFGVFWLVEPKWTSLVDHWSGTMQHPNYPDNKYGQTISAFTHFSLIYSNRSLILADLQSMHCLSHLNINCTAD